MHAKDGAEVGFFLNTGCERQLPQLHPIFEASHLLAQANRGEHSMIMAMAQKMVGIQSDADAAVLGARLLAEARNRGMINPGDVVLAASMVEVAQLASVKTLSAEQIDRLRSTANSLHILNEQKARTDTEKLLAAERVPRRIPPSDLEAADSAAGGPGLLGRLSADSEPGKLFLVGGEYRVEESSRTFAANKKVVVITYSETEGRRYNDFFLKMGAKYVDVVLLKDKAAADQPLSIRALLEADCVFIPGGNQDTYVELLEGTKFLKVLKDRHATGKLNLGGTSAGAMLLTDVARTPSGVVTLISPPQTRGFTIDTHLTFRNRLPQLIEYARLNKDKGIAKGGIGIDEGTSFTVNSQGIGTVAGSGHVYIVIPKEDRDGPYTVIIKLSRGDKFDLNVDPDRFYTGDGERYIYTGKGSPY